MWKQPIPTDIVNNQNIDTLSRLIFYEIIVTCQNQGSLFNFIHNKKRYCVELKRGQCIFKIDKFSKDLKMGRKKVRKSLEILSKWHSEMDIKGMPYGCIITVKNYDEIVKMDNKEDIEGTIEGQSRDSQGTSNKIDKIDKIEKKESINTLTPIGDIEIPQYGNKEINGMLIALKKTIGIDDFTDSQRWSRVYGKHCLTLCRYLGADEFKRRLNIILEDDFKHKNCNSIKYVYNQVKGFIEPPDPICNEC